MKTKNKKSEKTSVSEKTFLLITSCLSMLIALLYAWKGFNEGFVIGTWCVIGFNLLYIPFALIFRRKGFLYFYLIYAGVLIFVLAFHKTYLYNNFTALFIAFVIYLIEPRLKLVTAIGYFILVSAAYALNEEEIYHYFIHITRAAWFYYISTYVIEQKFQRKKLILYEDEINILTQLCNNRLQKSIEFEGYSESTIYRRLKSAMTRNHMTKKELLEEFRKEYLKKETTE